MKLHVIGVALLFTATLASANDYVVSSTSAVGCQDLDLSKRAQRYAQQGDMEAGKKLIVGALVAGTCVAFEKGDMLYDSGGVKDKLGAVVGMHNFVKLRRPGGTQEYWFNLNAVTKVSKK